MGQETPASVYSIPASRVSKGNLTGMRAVGRVELGSLTASSWQVSIWMFFRSLCAHLSCSRLLCTQALKLNTSGLPLFSVQPAQRLIPLSNGNKNPPHLNTDLSNDQPGQIIWASRHSGQPHTKTIDPQQNTFLFIWRMEFGRILNLNPKCKGFRSQPGIIWQAPGASFKILCAVDIFRLTDSNYFISKWAFISSFSFYSS